MTAVAGHSKTFARFFIPAGINILVLAPSLAAGLGLLNDALPLQPALKISYLILFLASVNFATVIMLEPYRRHFSKLSPAALLTVVAVVFLFIVNESLKMYFPHMDYSLLTPLIVAGVVLVYTTILAEKSVPLKCLLSLDSIALMFLWGLGAADKFTMPF
jgi:hypothetical protein